MSEKRTLSESSTDEAEVPETKVAKIDNKRDVSSDRESLTSVTSSDSSSSDSSSSDSSDSESSDGVEKEEVEAPRQATEKSLNDIPEVSQNANLKKSKVKH